ncbi:hypothetical protein O1611_g7827 [Lasiodiplodia mahajangana]|uniref:Uncharacterized protein n=1 Tax=Lasiodiplodia mahajangana TaxID=1108764 RepID=A0ACC2JE49_9PEZI|nr:hypothetical protein O1611_g7827 [Lasiodiplodia mahajangana]
MDCDGDTSSQPDQYARDNQLSIDSQTNPFYLALQIDSSVPQPTLDAGPGCLTSDALLPRLHLPTAGVREELDIAKGPIDLLANALQHDDINTNDQYEMPLAQYEARKRLAKLKLELPTLPSDPDYDCDELATTIREQRQPSIDSGLFPLERLNANNDEGLEFPNYAHQFKRKLDQMLCHEKLDVTREAVYHLVCALRGDWSDDDNRRVLVEAMPRPKFMRDLVITPPLSPYTDTEECFVPDAEVCEVPIISDLDSMLSDDLAAAESTILQNELEKDISPIFDGDSLQFSPLLDPLALVRELPKVDLIKMESPLLPISSPLQPTNAKPTIPGLLKSMDMDHALSDSESSKIDVLGVKSQNEAIGHTLQTIMGASAAVVLKSIEQEHVSIADAIARVEPPIMDFSIPEPEWESFPMIAQVHLKWLLQSYEIELPPWKKDLRAETKLRWIPFLQTMDWRTLTKETVDCERDMSSFLNILDAQEVPTSANYVWKRPGLAILHETECEECLETTSPIKSINDLAGLAKKRRFENNLVDTVGSSSPSSCPSIDLIVPCKRTLENPDRQTNLLPNLESNLTVSILLSNYIDMHTAKRRKQDRSSFFPPTSKPEVKSQPVSTTRLHHKKEYDSSISTIRNEVKRRPTPQSLCPEIGFSNPPTKLIKGLTLSRGLFSKLERLYPTAEIIERDFDRWNTLAWGSHSVLRSTVTSSLAAEADVIVSPATGIIVTTLLKAIQKPLPGHVKQSSIRERIGCVSLRYERLIVLVSEGNVVDETVRDLALSEITAYSEFVGFVSGLDSKVEVFYVGGGEATLARWIVSFAGRYAPEAAEIQEHLIQDETQWEVFLRRAGFNAYAAQAILVRLKGEDHNSEENEYSSYGLAGFMMMTETERLCHFHDLMGGENVLNRVNRMLETRWS